MIKIEKEVLSKWPLHDAEVIYLLTESGENGRVTVRLRLEINPYESLEPFTKLGITSSIIDIVFVDCNRVIWDVCGNTSNRDVLMDWDIKDNSAMYDELKKRGVPLAEAARYAHCHFEFNNGSILDILCSELSIEDSKIGKKE